MKKYLLEIIVILLQIGVFYLSPLVFKMFNLTIVIVGMLLATFGLSMMMVVVSKKKIRYLYPILASILYSLSVSFFYNNSAYGIIIWYFLVSVVGVLLGFLIDKFIDSIYNKKSLG